MSVLQLVITIKFGIELVYLLVGAQVCSKIAGPTARILAVLKTGKELT